MFKSIGLPWPLDIEKVLIFSKLVYRLNIIPNKIPPRFFVDIDKIIPKFIWKVKGTIIAKIIFKQIIKFILFNSNEDHIVVSEG